MCRTICAGVLVFSVFRVGLVDDDVRDAGFGVCRVCAWPRSDSLSHPAPPPPPPEGLERKMVKINPSHLQRILARSRQRILGRRRTVRASLASTAASLPLRAQPRQSQERHLSVVHACDRLPVARGRRRVALLRCGDGGVCLPAVLRHAPLRQREAPVLAAARGIVPYSPTRPARARAPDSSSCSYSASGVTTSTPLRRELPPRPRAARPQRHHPHQAGWANVKLELSGRRVLGLEGAP